MHERTMAVAARARGAKTRERQEEKRKIRRHDGGVQYGTASKNVSSRSNARRKVRKEDEEPSIILLKETAAIFIVLLILGLATDYDSHHDNMLHELTRCAIS